MHHVGDLGSVDVVALVREAPGERQEPETGELLEDIDHLGKIHLAAPDGERDSQPLQTLEAGQLSDLLRCEASVAQHSLRLNLQQEKVNKGEVRSETPLTLTSSSTKFGM